MRWWVTAAGAAMVLLILRDVFHTLWHPTRHGGLSRLVMTLIWRLSAHVGPRLGASGLTGPLGIVSVVVLWVLTVVAGWALIYWPHLPEGFAYSDVLRPADREGLLDAAYVSLVTVSTLGLGDIAPSEGWLRVVAPLEGLVGFALLTATVSWILGIYPALARRRALALRLSHLLRAYPPAERLDTPAGAALLLDLAEGISVVTVDFLQYPESYYFYDGDDRTSLARHVGYAARTADVAAHSPNREVRAAGAVLRTALDDLGDVLDQRFLRIRGSPQQALDAFMRDHARRAGRDEVRPRPR